MPDFDTINFVSTFIATIASLVALILAGLAYEFEKYKFSNFEKPDLIVEIEETRSISFQKHTVFKVTVLITNRFTEDVIIRDAAFVIRFSQSGLRILQDYLEIGIQGIQTETVAGLRKYKSRLVLPKNHSIEKLVHTSSYVLLFRNKLTGKLIDSFDWKLIRQGEVLPVEILLALPSEIVMEAQRNDYEAEIGARFRLKSLSKQVRQRPAIGISSEEAIDLLLSLSP